VGPERISQDEFAAAAQSRAAELKRELSADERRALLLAMVNQRLLVAEARRRKLDREPAFKAAREDWERRALAERVYNDEVASKAQADPRELKQLYDREPSVFDELELGQIVIAAKGSGRAAAQQKAEALAKRLAKDPKGFAAAAKAESSDEQSKAKGGMLGWVNAGQMLTPLAQAAVALKPGSVSGPVETEFGFHVLYLKARRPVPFERAAEGLAKAVQAERASALQKALLEKLAKDNKLKLPEGNF
jgi:parvulin-like peptidyl-prolyl isomerase